MLIICGLTSSFGLYLLSRASMRSGPKSSYFAVAHLTYPKASFLIDLSIAITCFGSAVSYLVVIGDLMPAAVQTFATAAGNSELPEVVTQRWFWITMFAIILLPLVFFEKLESIKFFSYIGLISIGFMLYVMVYYIADPNFLAEIRKPIPDILLFNVDRGFFIALPTFVFGYTCHMNVCRSCRVFLFPVFFFACSKGLTSYFAVVFARFSPFATSSRTTTPSASDTSSTAPSASRSSPISSSPPSDISPLDPPSHPTSFSPVRTDSRCVGCGGEASAVW
jgi:hypothetical protein